MRIYGVRVYPQTVTTIPGHGAPIFVHGKLAEERSDVDYIFRPIASRWKNHYFVKDFAVSYGEQGIEDPIPGLRERYGPDFHAADLKTQLLVIRADGFLNWAPRFHSCEGTLLLLFSKSPSFELLQRLFWDRNFVLSCDTWPKYMRGVLHNWDDMFWQLFSVDQGDVDLLISHHLPDPKLKMFFVEFDAEYPDPSNNELTPVE